MEGHAVHDDASYVPKEMFEEWAKRDPLERYRTWLRENADFTDEEEEEIRGYVKKILNDAVQRADGVRCRTVDAPRRRLRHARRPRDSPPQVSRWP